MTYFKPFEPLLFSRGLMWTVTLFSSLICGFWCLGNVEVLSLLSVTMRPNSALGALACALGLGGLLYPRSLLGWRGLRLGFPLCAIGLGSATLLALLFGSAALARPLVSVSSSVPATMPPLAALMLVLQGLCLLVLQTQSPRRIRQVVPHLVSFIFFTSGAFVLSALMGRVSAQTLTPSVLMLPGAGLCFTFLSAALFLLLPSYGVNHCFFEMQEGAALGRRLIVRCALLVLFAAFADISLLKLNILTAEECTALCASAVMLALCSAICRHGMLVTLLLRLRDNSIIETRRLLDENKDLIKMSRHKSAQLASVLQAMSNISIIETDLDGQITFCSSGFEKMLGYCPKEAIGNPLMVLLHCQNELRERANLLGIDPSFDIFRALANLGHTEEQAWSYRNKAGDLIPVHVATSAIKDPSGTIIGYLAVARNMTEERGRQRARDGFFAIGHELLCITDASGVFRTVSPSFTRVMGYTPAELIGRPFYDFVHPDDRPVATQIPDRVNTELVLERYENRWRTKDGRYRWVTWDASAPYNDGLVYAGGWDITEEKVRDAKRLETILFEQKLIGITSHDLRNPISAISLSAHSLLRHQGDSEKMARSVKRIVEACKRAEDLIHDILDFTQARIGSGLRIKPENCEITHVVEEIVDELRASYPKREIVREGVQFASLSADANRLKQMLGNLLANSLTYSPEDAPVTVHLGLQGTKLCIGIHNTGDPIPTNLLSHLFEPFKGNHSAAGQEQHSLGLGLFIVREIVRAHNGTIDVQSSIEAGTLFRVTLPVIGGRCEPTSEKSEAYIEG